MDAPRTYTVEVSHPTNYHTGKHAFTVRDTSGALKYRGMSFRYVSAAGFGCSRDYCTKTDAEAISTFLAEHACKVVGKMRKTK